MRKPRTLLVDIDMFFDLRMALVEALNSNVGVVMLHDRSWYKRESDKAILDKVGITSKQFWGMYRENFVELLKNSYATYFANNIMGITNEILDDNAPGQSPVRNLIINVPFGRLEDQDIEWLYRQFAMLFDGYFQSIEFKCLDHHKLNIYSMLNQGITDFFCYQWQKWLKYHYADLDKNLKQDFRVWFPTLLADELEEGLSEKNVTQERKEKILAGNNIFELIGYLHCPAFETHWIKTEEVCLYLPE